ncbi:MAG: hypothetical protein KF761_14450 [Salinibacterium sp.]|nr:hypothetical protein [Salinibacterium sp.]
MLKAIAVGVTGVLLSLVGAVVMSSGTGCTAQPVDVDQVAALDTAIAGYSDDQLVNAAIIMNVATARGLGQQAQIVGVTTAIAQTGLRNQTATDGSTGLGVFAQGAAWGSAEQRLDPAHAALLFYARLEQVPNWQTLTPAAAATQITGHGAADYTAALKPATEIVSTLTPTEGQGCQVSGDSQALALELVQAMDGGTFTALTDPEQQIRWIAEGRTISDCGIDVRTLQVMVLATRQFDRVGVSSINRLCTHDDAGGGTLPHVREGGGKSVDFYMLDDIPLTGADGLTLRLIGMLDPIVPAESRIGQSNCRDADGVNLGLQHFTEFTDTCNHLHVDFADTDGALTVG